jgi:glyceraldehyde 3-phosphate dehydrogenase
MAVRIGINGFGRIGRQVFKSAFGRNDVEVVAVNDLTDVRTMAHLLKYDSIHGIFPHEVQVRPNALEINGNLVNITSLREPEKLLWRDFDVDIVAECTGHFRDRDSASKHLEGGARKVIISAPAKDPDITIVMGVNANQYDPKKHDIISCASCTTNCLAPVAKVILENFGIVSGLMTTIHSYTGDQRLLDFPHKDLRRARAAAMSMIPTTTGAAEAVALVLPELFGRLTGLAVRVPTPNVSLVDFVVSVEKSGVTGSDVNDAFKTAAESSLAGILEFCDQPLVSVDFLGSTSSSIVDSMSTYVVGNMVKVLSWYDNEAGYSQRMVDLALMTGQQL